LNVLTLVILDFIGRFSSSLSFSIVRSNPFLSANAFISSISFSFYSSSFFCSASRRSCSESLSSSSSSSVFSELLQDPFYPSESSASNYSSSSSFSTFLGVIQLNSSNSSFSSKLVLSFMGLVCIFSLSNFLESDRSASFKL
jgi:hypothetical protein